MKQRTHLMIVALFMLLAASNTFLHAQTTVKFDQPVLITSAGQSADVTIAGTLFKKANVAAKALPLAKASDLEGIKTLVVVAGYSSKGLGAAGISREQEMSRVQSILQAAREKKLRIITLHIGGKARRGNQSDDFNRSAAEAAGYLLVVKQGNEDQFFSKIASEKKIPLDLVDRIADAVSPLAKAFAK